MSVYPMTNPRCEPCGNQRRPEEAVHVADSQTAVDYKKLIDLDHSEVVANFADFDCSVCLMNVPSGVGITLRECLHNFCRYAVFQCHFSKINEELNETDQIFVCFAVVGIAWLTSLNLVTTPPSCVRIGMTITPVTLPFKSAKSKR